MMRSDLNYVLPLRDLVVLDWSTFAQGLRPYLQLFLCPAPKECDELPDSVVTCKTISCFKIALRKHLSAANEAYCVCVIQSIIVTLHLTTLLFYHGLC